jgi:hypothetical protein
LNKFKLVSPSKKTTLSVVRLEIVVTWARLDSNLSSKCECVKARSQSICVEKILQLCFERLGKRERDYSEYLRDLTLSLKFKFDIFEEIKEEIQLCRIEINNYLKSIFCCNLKQKWSLNLKRTYTVEILFNVLFAICNFKVST